jgi:hypothetical protein
MTTDSIGHETGCEQNHSFMMAWRVHEFGPPGDNGIRVRSTAGSRRR